MKKTILCILAFVVTGWTGCLAQNIWPDVNTFTNWGESVHGVRMSAALETNVYTVGSTLRIYTRVENQSTNDVRFQVSNPLANFKVVMVDSSEKKHVYHIEREIQQTLNYTKSLKGRGYFDLDVATTIGSDVDVGDCKITVSRFVSTKVDGKFEIQSNVIKAKISK